MFFVSTGPGRPILFMVGLCTCLYFLILVAVAAVPHDTTLKVGAPYCEDDVCISVDEVARTSGQAGTEFRFNVRLFSRANHGIRSTKGASIYLVDDRDRRFFPSFDPSVIPFDTILEPGKSFNTRLSFRVPADTQKLYLAASAAKVRYASFIVGNGDLLGNPIIKLQIQ